MTDDTKEHKHNILLGLVEKHKNAKEQRSTEWYSLMHVTFGGSEQAVISGNSKYGHVSELVAKKAKLITGFSGNIYTRWGVVMEKVTNKLMEIILSSKIYEFGAIIGPVDHQRCSPDGITLARIKWEGEYKWLLILMEYKNPFTRIPSKSIPDDYVHQLRTGLCTIPELDISLFVDSMMRACKRGDYKFNPDYNMNIHSSDLKSKDIVPCNPLSMGTIIIYQTRKQRKRFMAMCDSGDDTSYRCRQSNCVTTDDIISMFANDNQSISDRLRETDDIKAEEIVDKLIDFGTCSFSIMGRLLEMIELDLVSIYYLYPCIFRKELSRVDFIRKQKSPLIKEYTDEEWSTRLDRLYQKENEKFVKGCDHLMGLSSGYVLLGFLHWKQFKLSILPFKNDNDEYLQDQSPKMQELMGIIKEIGESKTPWATFHKYYPTRYKNMSDDSRDTEEDYLQYEQSIKKMFVAFNGESPC
jgi:hypothetical protein